MTSFIPFVENHKSGLQPHKRGYHWNSRRFSTRSQKLPPDEAKQVLSRITIGTAVVGLAAMVYWRFAVRRHTLPCPSWLSWLLENPFMNSVAGAETILDRLDLKAGMKLLDVGCGPGRLTIPAARHVGINGHVTALDVQPEMLGRVDKKLQAASLTNVSLVHAGIGEGKTESDTFDRAVLVTVLGEIPDRQAALAEIYRALKPGGILSVTEVLPDPHYQTASTVRRLASAAGFEEQSHFGGFPAFTIQFRKPDVHSSHRVKVEGLNNVSKTLLIALYLRALESRRPNGLIDDPKAAELVNQLDFDFSKLKRTTMGQIFPLMRMQESDRRISTFLSQHPDGIIVDIGCGLDTRFYRVDNGKATWYELDLPEVMAIRSQLLGESSRRHAIACSALDFRWMDKIHRSDEQPILFLAEGVFLYFEQQDVKRLVVALCERFPDSELVFDALPPGFVRWMRWHPSLKAANTRLGWGLAQGKELEQWHSGIQLMSEWFYFDQPEPRLRWYRLLKWFRPISKTLIVQYRLGKEV